MSGKSIVQANQGGISRVLIVDDHPLVCEGLLHLIRQQADLECCGQAGSRFAAQQLLASTSPHLVIVDIRLQGGDGLELLKYIKAQHPNSMTLVVSQCDEQLYAERALKAGARGYLMKERATEEVLTAIRTVLAGGLYVSPKIATLALENMIGARPGNSNRAVHNLTDRELQVLQLLGSGLGSRKVAARLFLSVKTVETHRENIKHKLGLGSAPELIRFATDWLNGQSSQLLPDSSLSSKP